LISSINKREEIDVPYAEKEITRHFRPRYKDKLIINCGFRLTGALSVIEDDLADAVAFGIKPFTFFFRLIR
jgi:hypothetical protein